MCGYASSSALPYTLEVLGASEKQYGVLLSLFGLGGLFGGYICNWLSRYYRNGQIIVAMGCMEPIIMALWLWGHSYILSLILFFIWGINVFVRITAQLNHISETVETEYLTRMYGLLDMVFLVPTISGGLVISIIGNEFSTLEFLWTTSIVFLLLTIPRLFFKEMKSLYKGRFTQVKRNEDQFDTI